MAALDAVAAHRARAQGPRRGLLPGRHAARRSRAAAHGARRRRAAGLRPDAVRRADRLHRSRANWRLFINPSQVALLEDMMHGTGRARTPTQMARRVRSCCARNDLIWSRDASTTT
ncbi:MAG: hypothetical protein MZV49_01950 [Rhodopseudomonas palustris]|nr:hypothetical protein [Rhodopseudomonas palustris]